MTRIVSWIDDTGATFLCGTFGQFTPPVAALGPLSFSATYFTTGNAASGTILGATAGSTIYPTALPTGFAINSAALTFTYDGTGAAGLPEVVLTEALANSPNSPNLSVFGITVSTTGGLDFSLSGNPLVDDL